MTNHDLDTTFIVLQTFWDLFLLLGFAVFISVTIAYLSTYVWTEEQIESFLNKR